MPVPSSDTTFTTEPPPDFEVVEQEVPSIEVTEEFTGEMREEPVPEEQSVEEPPAKVISEFSQKEITLEEKEREEELSKQLLAKIAENEKNRSSITAKTPNELIQEITRTYDYNELARILQNTRQRTFKIVEIKTEEELDLRKTIQQIREKAEYQIDSHLQNVRMRYENEIQKIETAYKKMLAGQTLLDATKAIFSIGWHIEITNGEVYFVKFYNPPYPVIEGFAEENGGKRIKYISPVCTLKSIVVKAAHPFITSGTIIVRMKEGRHPNVNNSNDEACHGKLGKRVINIANPVELQGLLMEIAQTYQRIHLDSAYYNPDISYKTIERNTVWTAYR